MIWNPWKQNRILRERSEMYFNLSGELNLDKDRLSALIQEMKHEAVQDKKEINRLLDGSTKMKIALQRIADQENPPSNAEVRRMVAIARVALDK